VGAGVGVGVGVEMVGMTELAPVGAGETVPPEKILAKAVEAEVAMRQCQCWS